MKLRMKLMIMNNNRGGHEITAPSCGPNNDDCLTSKPSIMLGTSRSSSVPNPINFTPAPSDVTSPQTNLHESSHNCSVCIPPVPSMTPSFGVICSSGRDVLSPRKRSKQTKQNRCSKRKRRKFDSREHRQLPRQCNELSKVLPSSRRLHHARHQAIIRFVKNREAMLSSHSIMLGMPPRLSTTLHECLDVQSIVMKKHDPFILGESEVIEAGMAASFNLMNKYDALVHAMVHDYFGCDPTTLCYSFEANRQNIITFSGPNHGTLRMALVGLHDDRGCKFMELTVDLHFEENSEHINQVVWNATWSQSSNFRNQPNHAHIILDDPRVDSRQ